MGRIGDSFKREIGKNTGKFVSNLVFGDKHSTPYRRVDAERRAAVAARKAEAEIERQERADLNILDGAVLQNVDIVLQTRIPRNTDEMEELMSMWSAQLENSKWNYWNKEGKIRNQYPNALMSKYHQCLFMLKSTDSANPMLAYYKRIYIMAKTRRFFSMLGNPWVVMLLPLAIFIILGIAGVFD